MFEFLCILIIIALIWHIMQKKEVDTFGIDELKNENNFLRNKINEHNLENKNREDRFNETIKQLQSSLSKQQDSSKITNLDLKTRESKLIEKVSQLQAELNSETEARKKVLSQKKSGEVRLGHIAETLAPFLDQFDFEPERCSFLGQPIDYISFGDDEITFIEVKSGNSQLSQKQRHIRDLVNAKLVSWKEVRIK